MIGTGAEASARGEGGRAASGPEAQATGGSLMKETCAQVNSSVSQGTAEDEEDEKDEEWGEMRPGPTKWA